MAVVVVVVVVATDICAVWDYFIIVLPGQHVEGLQVIVSSR